MKRISICSILITLFLPLIILSAPQSNKDLLTGADVLFKEKISSLKGKNIGIVANQTSLLKNGTHLIDSIYACKEIHISCLFSPEHGIRGNAEAGAAVNSEIDLKTGLKIVSLYGKNYKIQSEDLKGIDILLFDLQDVGVRYFTYISTLKYVIEACAENNVDLWILDRPNPVSPLKTDGPLTSKDFISFVSIAPIPILHGMTVGETGLYFNYFLSKEKKKRCRITVVKVRNWDRTKFNSNFGTKWVKPSPNMTSLETAIIYGGTCLIEGTNVSEGRGTQKPFLTIGAPFIKSNELISELRKIKPAGLDFLPVQFTPVSIKGTATAPKYENTLCDGIEIKITNPELVQPVKFGVEIIYILHKLYPEFTFKDKTIDNLFGNDYLRKMINSGEKPEKIISKWQKELNNFINLRSKFLLYKS